MRGSINLSRQLQVLAQRHGVTLSSPRRVPKITLADQDPLILEGVASTGDVDCDHVCFLPYCYGSTLPVSVPLLVEHEHPVGTAVLTYDKAGGLRIRTSPLSGEARGFSAFSIAVRQIEFSLRDIERRSFYAEISACIVTECSLTQYPHNGAALLSNRLRPSANAAFWGVAQDFFAKAAEIVTLLQKEVHRESPSN